VSTQPDSQADSTPLRQRLRDALAPAMKARDRVTVGVLRSTLAAIENAEAVDGSAAAGSAAAGSALGGSAAGSSAARQHLAIERSPVGAGATEVARRVLAEADVERIVRAEIAEREAAARDYDRVGRPEHAARLRDEIAVLSAHVTR
jgi:uncharacterized protein